MRALLLALLFVPAAAAASAYPDGASWGEHEAHMPVRADGVLLVVADAPIEVALAAPDAPPASWSPAPTELAPASGEWRGLEGLSVLWLRRAAPESVIVEISDGAREGVVFEWPSGAKTPGLGLLMLTVGCVVSAHLRRGC